MKNPPVNRPRPPAAAGPTVLVLLRHGDAGDALALPERDALRPLTPKGQKQARRAGKALARAGLLPRDVWTSRLVRAQETAGVALAAARATPRVTSTAALAPDAVPERILRALADTPPPPPPVPDGAIAGRTTRRRGRAPRRPIDPPPVVRWLVGHDPHLSRLVAMALGAPPTAIRMPKGACAVVAFDGRGPATGTGVLTSLVDPDLLKAIRRG
jgi:phosphohistidine phosphatase SixA